MYYQNLKNMRPSSLVKESDIKRLDEWLIRIPYRNRNNLNFLQFSIDEDINEEIAFQLFMSATGKDTEVLQKYYNVVSNDRMHSLGIYNCKKQIPNKIYNYENEEYMLIKDNNIEVKFKLIGFPVSTPSLSTKKNEKKTHTFPTVEGVKKYSSYEDLSRLFH